MTTLREAGQEGNRRRRQRSERPALVDPALQAGALDPDGRIALLPHAPSADGTSLRDPLIDRTRHALRLLFGPVETRPFGVRLWNGMMDGAAASDGARFTLVLRTPGALRDMLLPPSELRLGEAFVRDLVDIEGDLETAQAVVDALSRRAATPRVAAHLLASLLRLPRGRKMSAGRRPPSGPRWMPLHSPQRDAAAVRAHYDVGNEFYALWLDRRMVYSCAYFETGAEDIDTAQQAKLEHLCRKLRLRPGERLLDIGCGWGGLIIYAATHFGVEALGITLSEAQAAFTRERIAAAGLGDRCRVQVSDYRDAPIDGMFDKVVSVGMCEHVGPTYLPTYLGRVHRLLAPGGLFLNHGIVIAPRPPGIGAAMWRRLWREGEFIGRYVFPDGELVPLAALVAAAEAAHFETRDVESLREHYTLTLRHWVARLERKEAEAVRLTGRQTFRVWRLYMAASAHAFATGHLGLAQVLFAKPAPGGIVGLPPTRADLYAAPATHGPPHA